MEFYYDKKSTGRKGRRGAGGQGREEWGKNRVSKDANFFKV